ncbi:MAG TPA: nucleotide exchange factor GrpE [Candidatus Limnocylindrales bacterium]|nr:nucleotide exchange factor GrpE [Candidatus Limnocylindrales bacterium]
MDRRTRAQQRAEEIDISPTKLLADIERLTAERDAAGREKDEFLAALQRERAEFVNFRRRTAEERQAMLGLAAEGLISKVLALADDFDRAIEARPSTIADDPWVEGIAAIDRKLRQLLESEGVSAIDAVPGTPFDPREHEAVASVPGTDHPDGSIVVEVRRGYRLRDRVLRPALVAVAAHDDATDGAATTTDEPIH